MLKALCAIALMTLLVFAALAQATKPTSHDDSYQSTAKIAKVTSFNALDLAVVAATHADRQALVVAENDAPTYNMSAVFFENKLAYSRLNYPLRS